MAYLSKIANQLLYTPFDNKAIVEERISSALTVDEFINNCYVKPDFELNEPYNKALDNNIEIYDYIYKQEMLNDAMYFHKKMKVNFDQWLNNKNAPKVYTVCGNAGTGKTTYINYLKNKSKNTNWIILDSSKSHDRVKWLGNITSLIYDFTFANKKMYSCVLEEIKRILFNDFQEDGRPDYSKIFDRISNISKIYNKKFKSFCPDGKEFFDEFSLKKIEYFKSKPKVVEEHAYLVKKYFDNLEVKYKSHLNQLLREALDILLMLLRCSNTLSSNDCHIIVFDNLERFIACDEIHNKDLDEIRKSLISYSETINTFGSSCHYGKFKFIMVMRNRSAKMCRAKDQSTDELASNLDLNGWFIIDKIINQRKKWLSKQSFESDDMKLLEQIAGDMRICEKSAITGLKLQIDTLFNYNARLIIDFLGILIELPSNTIAIKKYQELWKQDTAVSRFAARSIIRGLILKVLEDNDNLFMNLKVYSADNQCGIGHVRKILTVLYNNDTPFMSLDKLLSMACGVNEIADYWHSNMPINEKKTIAEVLYYMNSYNRREDDWIHFIDLQLKSSKNSVSIEDANDLFNKLEQNMEDYTVTIMPAGESYLKYIVASFEYFSFRYHKTYASTYVPLFVAIPSYEEIEKCNNYEDLLCIKIINAVKDKAVECIEIMNQGIDITININKVRDEKYHVTRIIDQHKGYIDNFTKYIKEQCIKRENSQLINEKYTNLIDKCIEIRNQYT